MKPSLVIVAALSALVVGKNVANLEDFRKAIEKELGHEKREAKNIFKVESLKELEEGHNMKREAKNVFNLKSLQQLDTKDKREDKSEFSLNALKELRAKSKREAKNVFRIEDFKGFDTKRKRSSEHQVTFSVASEGSHDNVLQSVLPKLQEISIFSGYLRESKEIYGKTEDESEIMVIIAPSNEAVSRGLNGLKPWEFPIPLGSNEEENDKKIESNIESFVKHHLILNFEEHMEFADGNVVTSSLASGGKVKILQNPETDKYQISVVPNEWINVESVAQVVNGFIFVVEQCLVTP